MLITLAEMMDAAALDGVRQSLAALTWRDGAETAGTTARAVKRNEQADLSTREGASLHARLLGALEAHPVLQAAARPRRFSRLMVSRTAQGGGYGMHVDNALMGTGAGRIRTDLSFTLFLSPPEQYAGGELVLHLHGGTQSLKLPAGGLVLYPSTTLHEVAPVTSGERLVCVGWIESLVRDALARETLFDLENLRADLAGALPPTSPHRLTLDKAVANLLRLWADT